MQNLGAGKRRCKLRSLAEIRRETTNARKISENRNQDDSRNGNLSWHEVAVGAVEGKGLTRILEHEAATGRAGLFFRLADEIVFSHRLELLTHAVQGENGFEVHVHRRTPKASLR